MLKNKSINLKGFLILLSILTLVFLSLNSISAVNTCYVASSSANCLSTSGKVVMHLSSVTNAHGELLSQTNYAPVLCCNFGGGDISCNNNPNPTLSNKALKLSSATNAHAERPENTAYSQNVCYQS